MKHLQLFEEFINEGTGNFYSVNASKIYAIGGSSGATDDGEDDDMTEDDIANIKSDLKSKGYDMAGKKDTPHHDNRNFSGTVLASKSESKEFESESATMTIYAVARSGYYEGACLDWELSTELGGVVFWDDEKIEYDDVKDNLFSEEVKAGREEYQEEAANAALSWIENTKDKLVSELEKIYKDNSTPLVVSARFSSGETHYAKAKD